MAEEKKERERERALATWSNSMDWILWSWMTIESWIWGLNEIGSDGIESNVGFKMSVQVLDLLFF